MDYEICPDCDSDLSIEIDEKNRLVIFDCETCGFHEEVRYGSVRDLP